MGINTVYWILHEKWIILLVYYIEIVNIYIYVRMPVRRHFLVFFSCRLVNWTFAPCLDKVRIAVSSLGIGLRKETNLFCHVSSAKINKTVELGNHKRPEFHISMCKPLSLLIHKGLVALCPHIFIFYINSFVTFAEAHFHIFTAAGSVGETSMGCMQSRYWNSGLPYSKTALCSALRPVWATPHLMWATYAAPFMINASPMELRCTLSELRCTLCELRCTLSELRRTKY
jgi:hypothetical protein